MRPRPLARGDIVLLPFPFTDLSGQKVRPALIISPDPTGEDLWVAFISSIMPPYQNLTDHVLDVADAAFAPTGLKGSSVFRMSKLASCIAPSCCAVWDTPPMNCRPSWTRPCSARWG